MPHPCLLNDDHTDVFPIPGTKRAVCMEENMGALEVSMSAEDVTELEAAVPENEVAGTRYPNDEVCACVPACLPACEFGCTRPGNLAVDQGNSGC